ncbi:MAG: methyltransferase domain-containing protein, partial [Planctomycetes bacterium]|nr:methyltransferase domain-containing protein [Planctomycetota bacterium]
MRDRLIVILGLFAILFSCPAGAGKADGILDQTGVRGGLVVHLGCGGGRLLAGLGAGDGYILHGLETNPARVDSARKRLLSEGLYGKISVDLFDGEKLPYAENLVNLIIVESSRIKTSRREILRVLVPNGVALINGRKVVKPVPGEIDQWSHFEHGPENNAVAADTVVGPPRHLQWVSGPRWLRTHEEPSGITSMVTAGGRLFYTLDE